MLRLVIRYDPTTKSYTVYLGGLCIGKARSYLEGEELAVATAKEKQP